MPRQHLTVCFGSRQGFCPVGARLRQKTRLRASILHRRQRLGCLQLGGRGDKCVRLRSSGTFTCAHHVIHPGAFRSHGPGRRRRAFHIRYLGYCGRAVRPWQRRRRPATAVPGPDSGQALLCRCPRQPTEGRRPSGGCRRILTMPAPILPTAMPTCPSPTSSPSTPRTATGVVPRFGAMPVGRHAAARIEPLHFYDAVERGIARRITKNSAHPQPCCAASTADNGFQAPGCAPGLLTAAHLSSNLC
jgi:hypothetical protein